MAHVSYDQSHVYIKSEAGLDQKQTLTPGPSPTMSAAPFPPGPSNVKREQTPSNMKMEQTPEPYNIKQE